MNLEELTDNQLTDGLYDKMTNFRRINKFKIKDSVYEMQFNELTKEIPLYSSEYKRRFNCYFHYKEHNPSMNHINQ